MSATDRMPEIDAHAGLQDLHAYSLMSCLQDRRTRRVAQGVSLQAGEITYESPNQPSPLTPLEEAILIASVGVTGDGSFGLFQVRSPASRDTPWATRRVRRSCRAAVSG